MRPEGYNELTAYLNNLSGYAWKRILRASETNGNAGVVSMLRAVCGSDLSCWTDEELTEYLTKNDITNEENFPRDGRF